MTDARETDARETDARETDARETDARETDARQHPPGPPAPIDCETAVRRLWDFLDGELDDVRATEVEAHLDTCRRCPPHFAFARSLVRAIEAAGRAGGPPHALRARVLAALRAEGYQGGPG